MRWGELAGLRRRYLDLDGRRVRVVATVYEFGQLVKGKPRSEASKRKITLPELIMPELRRHLDTYSAPGPDGFVFAGVKGGQLRRSNFSKPWAQAMAKAGLPDDLHVHDLWHTGNTLAAEAGASLSELMNRMGRSSTRAARIYLHTRLGPWSHAPQARRQVGPLRADLGRLGDQSLMRRIWPCPAGKPKPWLET